MARRKDEATGGGVPELAGFSPPVRREARIDLRVTPEELEEIKATAEKVGLGVSEYLRQCHKRAVEALRKGATR
ncbi:MAG: hypothetical protein FJ290_25600 [Planctomycetes bacterium]|nr:hypothetical protein [Planctomycetota bacterium]